MIDSDGLISTAAGNGQAASYVDPGPVPATQTSIWHGSMYLFDDNNGGFYFTHWGPAASYPPCCYFRHVDGAGRMTAVWLPSTSYGGPLAAGQDRRGNIYLGGGTSPFSGVNARAIYRLVLGTGGDTPTSPAMQRILGNAEESPWWGSSCVEHITPKAVGTVIGLAFGPDDTLYASDHCDYEEGGGYYRLFKSAVIGSRVVSEDGREVYSFAVNQQQQDGRHMRTYHALTGGLLYELGYDPSGLLSDIRDGDGNVTLIERDAGGKPLAIVSPFGQRTELTLDGKGYLAGIRPDPNSPARSFVYSDQGLLLSQTDARGYQHSYQYDSLGRVERATDAAGKTTQYSLEQSPGYHKVTSTSPEGRITSYQSQDDGSGNRTLTVSFPDGTSNTSVLDSRTGRQTTTLSDGTVITQSRDSDPVYGRQYPITSTTVSTPAKLTMKQSSTRSVTLSDPEDPLTVTAWSESSTVNGKTSTTSYNGSTRTFTDSTPAGRTSTRTLDARGRVISASPS